MPQQQGLDLLLPLRTTLKHDQLQQLPRDQYTNDKTTR